MKITLRRQQDNNEMIFDTADNASEQIVTNWLAGQTGYVVSITDNPAQDNMCIPILCQQPKYNPRMHSGGLNPFLAYNYTTNAYTMIGVGPGVEYVDIYNTALSNADRVAAEKALAERWQIAY